MVEQLINGLRVDRDSDQPLTDQVEKVVLALVSEGALQPGHKLPKEEVLTQQLGVSRWTVSRAMGRLVQKGVIRRTRRAGTFVADKRTHSTDLGFFYFQEAAGELLGSIHHTQRFLATRKYDLRTLPFPFDYYEKSDVLAEARRLNLAGAILVALNAPGCRRQLLHLEAQGFPYVRVGNKCFVGHLRAPLITGDDRRAAREAFAYLLDLGHRGVGYVSTHPAHEGLDEYRRSICEGSGYKERWLVEIPFAGTLAAWGDFPARQRMRDYLLANADVTAVVLEHGGMAVALAQEAQALGRAVPQDLSVLCLEDWPATFSAIAPGITSMRLSREVEMDAAAGRLLQIVESGPPDHEELVRIAYERVDRDSVAEPRGGM